ncbi:MAG: hypothetical protein IIB27_00800 [Chloroflexi bacterium]|nr:hypothetical protein [Chloroflexota bacterium]MCH7641936.1 hypothetical protein [Chloroflexota bacterium]
MTSPPSSKITPVPVAPPPFIKVTRMWTTEGAARSTRSAVLSRDGVIGNGVGVGGNEIGVGVGRIVMGVGVAGMTTAVGVDGIANGVGVG